MCYREAFLTIMDDEHGEWVYRNAVRVLLEKSADVDLFQHKAQPLPPDVSPPDDKADYRYVVVSRMVFEAWKTQGRIERRGTEEASGRPDLEPAWVLTAPKDSAEMKHKG